MVALRSTTQLGDAAFDAGLALHVEGRLWSLLHHLEAGSNLTLDDGNLYYAGRRKPTVLPPYRSRRDRDSGRLPRLCSAIDLQLNSFLVNSGARGWCERRGTRS